jgi:rubrerythrin
MKQMTEQNLINSFGGESMAHMRYLGFAKQAAKDHFSIFLGFSAVKPISC